MSRTTFTRYKVNDLSRALRARAKHEVGAASPGSYDDGFLRLGHAIVDVGKDAAHRSSPLRRKGTITREPIFLPTPGAYGGLMDELDQRVERVPLLRTDYEECS